MTTRHLLPTGKPMQPMHHPTTRWTGPLTSDLDPCGNLRAPVPKERWPYGPPNTHQGCCKLHDGGLFCDCAASAADDIEFGAYAAINLVIRDAWLQGQSREQLVCIAIESGDFGDLATFMVDRLIARFVRRGDFER